MAQTGYTPISLYKTTTASAVPSAANLVSGELGINLTDEILFFKNTAGTVRQIAANLIKVPNGGTGVTTISGLVFGNGTAAMSAAVSGTDIKTVNSTSILGSGNITVGTVTSVAALTLGTTGTDVSSSVATGTSTPVITLNIPSASSTNRGLLTSTDWSTFNNKQPAGTYATGTGTASGTNTGDNAVNTLYNGLVTNATHTGDVTGSGALTIAAGAVTYAKMQNVSATSRVLGRITTGAGSAEELTAANLKTILSLTSSDVSLGNVTNVAQVTSVAVASANGFAGSSSGGQTPSLTLSTSVTGIVKGNGTALSAATANSDYLVPALANTAVTGFKTATFDGAGAASTTTGAVTIDWSANQQWVQAEPTGAITYTFTAPPGICHLQLTINSDGTSTAQTITWPGTVIQYGQTWAGANNKKSIINFWYDGTNYHMVGMNQI